MRDVGNCPLLTSEEEETWAKQYQEARNRIQELLQEHPQVIIEQLKVLQSNPDRKKLSTYLIFSQGGDETLELLDENDEERLSELGSEALNAILDNSSSFVRECVMAKGSESGEASKGGVRHSIAEIIGPYLRTTGKVQFQQRFYADCVELFIKGQWEEDGLSAEAKVQCCAEMKAVRDREHAAMNALVEGNLRLVIAVARRFVNSMLPFSDLVQEGNIGLMRAIETFEWERGHRLSTYACYRIRQAISQALNAIGRPIRIPANILRLLSKIHHAEQKFLQENGVEPTDDELASLVGITAARLRALKRMEQQPISLQSMAGEDRDWNDLLADRSDPLAEKITQESMKDTLLSALDNLRPNEKDILIRRFGLQGQPQQSLEVIARLYHLTSERIRQIEATALLKLRRLYGRKYMDNF